MAKRRNQNSGSKNYSDNWMTPPQLARRIVSHFKPKGILLEPCYGQGAFFNALQEFGTTSTCENFFDWKDRVDWIVTNPPWSDLTSWMEHAFEISDNVVFLVPISKVFSSNPRWKALQNYGGIAEILYVDKTNNVWIKNVGMPLTAVHFKKQNGLITKWSDLNVPERYFQSSNKKRKRL